MRRVRTSATAIYLFTWAAFAPAQMSTVEGRTPYTGRLLFTFEESRLYLNDPADPRDDHASCVDVMPSDDSFRERMERFQNALVRIHDAKTVESWHCAVAIRVASIDDLEVLSPPQPFIPGQLSGYVPEKRIAHARDVRRLAIEAMRTIVRGNYEAFRRLKLLDPQAEAVIEQQQNDYAKRRFMFISQHSKEFFGAAMNSKKPRVIVRQFEGRSNATACICRRSTGCEESDAFDAPRLGSWGDAVFCFRFYYEGDQSDDYDPRKWRIADPVFG